MMLSTSLPSGILSVLIRTVEITGLPCLLRTDTRRVESQKEKCFEKHQCCRDVGEAKRTVFDGGLGLWPAKGETANTATWEGSSL